MASIFGKPAARALRQSAIWNLFLLILITVALVCGIDQIVLKVIRSVCLKIMSTPSSQWGLM